MEECEDCGYTCDTAEKLENHRKVHAVSLRCNPCDYNASSRAQWLDHVASPCHVALLSCRETADCDYLAETERKLKDHIRQVWELPKHGRIHCHMSLLDGRKAKA